MSWFQGSRNDAEGEWKMSEHGIDAPPPTVQRFANELPPEDLQAEFARYGIPAGDMVVRVSALQVKYDEEYDANRREYDEYLKRLERKKIKQEYEAAVREMKQLEDAATARDDKATSIVRQIEANAAPRHLVVRSISPLACCALLRAMRTNTNVLTLDLSNNHLDDIIGEAVGKMLLKNKRLRGLNLGFNALTPQSLGALGLALQQNAVLTSLSLESNPILASTLTTASAHNTTQAIATGSAMATFEAFMVAVAINTSLTSLNLFHTQMTFDVSRALARAFENNTTLIALEIGGNSIAQSDVAMIACKLQKNQALQAVAQEKHARVRRELLDEAEQIHAQQVRDATQKANAAWHDANTKRRAEEYEKQEWERARRRAEDDVRVAVEIEIQQKKYLQQLEEKNAKPAKGKK